MERQDLEQLGKTIRYWIIRSTTEAGSGHPTSSLSATDLMTCLMFGGFFRFDSANPAHPNNDRLIFSKGHAAPLLYALWAAAGAVAEEELMTLRKFGSRLEGHPTMFFPYAEAATGSLGQGLSIGVGMALNAKYIDKLPYRTFVLLGDSEMAEGSQWEAIQLAAHYKLDNLIGVIDVNRLGQRGETMYGHEIAAYERRVMAFGWNTVVIHGHNMHQVLSAFDQIYSNSGAPLMIIAQTCKGSGISAVQDKEGRHGTALTREESEQAIAELGEVDTSLRCALVMPENLKVPVQTGQRPADLAYPKDKPAATRRAYGNALARLYPLYPDMVVLDAEVSNSTYADIFKKAYPERFFEMYVAEQNMAGAALGLARRGKIPFISSFAAFLTRAFDQFRMARYSEGNIKICGSHAGVSIGEDGTSQMGLEDIAMFRAVLDCVVLYPSDAVSTEKLVEEAIHHKGMVYIRTTRKETPVLYDADDAFPIGGSKTVRRSAHDVLTIIGAGITVHEAIAACDKLRLEGINVRVEDLYSVKPIDKEMLREAALETRAIITVEDHYPEGGLGEAVRSALFDCPVPVYSLAVTKMPRSGKPAELMEYEGISCDAIIRKVKEVL
ncbi:MAG TPA: transketolase [Dissulfurispiraceae bacterium]|nr:transketolase [Dissulfurispiraceae bacterium]